MTVLSLSGIARGPFRTGASREHKINHLKRLPNEVLSDFIVPRLGTKALANFALTSIENSRLVSNYRTLKTHYIKLPNAKFPELSCSEQIDHVSRQFPNLRGLDLEENDLTWVAFERLSCLTDLENISLARCRGVTEIALRSLVRAVSVRGLDLSRSWRGESILGALRAIDQFTDLQRLSLDTIFPKPWLERLPNPPVHEVVLTCLGALSQLRSLNLGNCPGIQGPGFQFISNLTNLEDLDLSGCQDRLFEDHRDILQLEFISRLTRLLSLNLSGCWGLQNFQLMQITSLKRIEFLNLKSINAVNDDLLERFRSFCNLRELILSQCQMTAQGLSHIASMTNLTKLDFVGSGIADEGARVLSFLTNLTSLDLQSNRMTHKVFRTIGQLTNLIDLSISLENFRGHEELGAIENLVNLRRLNIGGGTHNQLTDQALRLLAGVSNLETLAIKSCSTISGAGFDAFNPSSKLEKLDLSYTHVNFEGLRHISRLFTNLRTLDLKFYPSFNDEGIRILSRLELLKSLTLDGCSVCDRDLKLIDDFFPDLTDLLLNSPYITDEGLAFISDHFRNLKKLRLDSEAITQDGVEQFISMHGDNLDDWEFGARPNESIPDTPSPLARSLFG